MIDQQTVARIHEAARIEEVVSDFVTLRKRGVNLLGLCPFHNERTPSFTVSPAKGIFKCFGCGKGGNAVNFVMEHEQMNYVDALKYLAKKYHIEVVEKELTAEEVAARNDRESMLLVNEFAQNYFSTQLHKHAEGKAVGLSYFRERGFREDIIEKFKLGYSLEERDAFTQTALKSGYKLEYLVKTGLTFEGDNNYVADRFRGRVLFPVHTISGKVVAFGGRTLRKDDKTAKYINSPESEIYHKSNELYGIFFAKQAIVRHDRCYLVEGYTDVLSMHQSGVENVVASSGTALTPGQIRMIHRFTENVTIIFDGDPAGIKASLRGIDLLLEEGMNIKVLLLPQGDDPDSFARKHNASDFIAYVEENSTDFIRFKTQLLLDDAGNDPIKRAGLVQDIVGSIAVIPNKIIQAEYVKESSNLLDVREETLYHQINIIRAKARQEHQRRVEREARTATAETAAPVTETGTIPQTPVRQFDDEERNLLAVLIKYGTHILYYLNDEEGNSSIPQTVSDYVFSELENDHLSFQNPVFRKIYEELRTLPHLTQEELERYFTTHADATVSSATVELITEKYTLSKIHSKFREVESDDKRLHELAPRYIYEYKLALIMNKRREKLLEMKKASESGDMNHLKELMLEIEEIDYFKTALSKELDRVLNML